MFPSLLHVEATALARSWQLSEQYASFAKDSKRRAISATNCFTREAEDHWMRVFPSLLHVEATALARSWQLSEQYASFAKDSKRRAISATNCFPVDSEGTLISNELSEYMHHQSSWRTLALTSLSIYNQFLP